MSVAAHGRRLKYRMDGRSRSMTQRRSPMPRLPTLNYVTLFQQMTVLCLAWFTRLASGGGTFEPSSSPSLLIASSARYPAGACLRRHFAHTQCPSQGNRWVRCSLSGVRSALIPAVIGRGTARLRFQPPPWTAAPPHPARSSRPDLSARNPFPTRTSTAFCTDSMLTTLTILMASRLRATLQLPRTPSLPPLVSRNLVARPRLRTLAVHRLQSQMVGAAVALAG